MAVNQPLHLSLKCYESGTQTLYKSVTVHLSIKWHIYTTILVTHIILFTRHLNWIYIIHTSPTSDILLVEENSSHYVFSTDTNWDCEANFTSIYSWKKGTMLIYLDSVSNIFFLFLNVVNNVKEVNPHWVPVLLLDVLLTSHTRNISRFDFKPKPFHFVSTIRVFTILQLPPTDTQHVFVVTKP